MGFDPSALKSDVEVELVLLCGLSSEAAANHDAADADDSKEENEDHNGHLSFIGGSRGWRYRGGARRDGDRRKETALLPLDDAGRSLRRSEEGSHHVQVVAG